MTGTKIGEQCYLKAIDLVCVDIYLPKNASENVTLTCVRCCSKDKQFWLPCTVTLRLVTYQFFARCYTFKQTLEYWHSCTGTVALPETMIHF